MNRVNETNSAEVDDAGPGSLNLLAINDESQVLRIRIEGTIG